MPAVSAIIAHHGDPSLARAVADQLRDTVLSVEVIVVDDASPEPFPELDGVHVVRREINGGFGAAVNSGVRVAVAPLLLILNSDLHVRPGFVDDLVAAAAPHQPCVAGPAFVTTEGFPVVSARRFPTTSQQVVQWLRPLTRFGGRRWWQQAVGHDLRALPGATVDVDWLLGAALLVPRAHFDAIGGFDERFFMTGEEVDLQRRLRSRGMRSMYLGTVTARHDGGGSTYPHRSRRFLMDGRRAYAAKWGGLRQLQLALTAASLVNLFTNLRRHPVRTLREELALIWR